MSWKQLKERKMISKNFSIEVIQSWMKQNLMFPYGSHNKEVSEIFNDSNKQTALQKLGVYQRSYYLRLLKCMREQYPALCYALGEDLFNDFAREYLQKHPSQSHTLYDLGTRFPKYLQETRPDKKDSEQWVEFMLDLVDFELRLYLMFDAPGQEQKTYADLKTKDEYLKLQPCFEIGCYGFNVSDYYHQVREDKSPSLPKIGQSMVCMVRNNFRTQTIPLKTSHYYLLKAMKNGKSVKQALEVVALKCQLDIEQVKQSWKHPKGIRNRWINQGFFISSFS